MPTPTKGPRLGGGPAHERLMLANLATQLFEHQRITTTEARAKRVRPLAERLITFAKRGDLASRRRVMTVVKDKGVVHVLFTEIAPLVAERRGGYTRITKIGPRKGDNAPMAVIELVLEPVKATTTEAEAATRRAARDAGPTGSTREAGGSTRDPGAAVAAEQVAEDSATDAEDAKLAGDPDGASEAAEDSQAAADVAEVADPGSEPAVDAEAAAELADEAATDAADGAGHGTGAQPDPQDRA